MALTLAQAKTLLAGIVGKTGGTKYLGLSKTAPQPIYSGTLPSTGASFNNYNITEPTAATSYARVTITATEFANDATGTYVGNDYVTTIANSKEIHFTEAIQNWGFYKYFFISTSPNAHSAADGSIIYVGELIYDKYVSDESYDTADYTEAGESIEGFDKTKTTNLNYDVRKNNLYVKEGDDYVNCGDKPFSEDATYFVKGLGVHIEANTVPLVRANLLKISVQ